MKKFLVFFLAMMLVFTVVASAKKKVVEMDEQEDSKPVTADNVLTVNILPMFMLQFNVGYERKLAGSLSLRGRANWWSMFSTAGWSIWGLGADLFVYPGGNACQGWFIKPQYDLLIMSYSEKTVSGTALTHMAGAQVGHQWVFEGGFAMGVGLGGETAISTSIDVKDSSSNKSVTTVTNPLSGMFWPTVDFTLGYAF